MSSEVKTAMKLVKKRYPFATSVKADPFYGWAIVIAKGSPACIVMKQRDEDAAWLAAASVVKR